MDQKITIARPAAEVFGYLADHRHLRHWLPHLRREESPLPEEGLEIDHATRTLAWSFAPAGHWRITGEGAISTLYLHLDTEFAQAVDPTERENPHSAAEHGAEAALQSLKSHIEQAEGGDPDLRMPPAPWRSFGHTPE
ncbi:SRPBCC family protein [Roseomonas sp. KE0001]|uniref:SRPBCC family protein n=1 Tax=Roseomonas sp. KE0001 TaxID=2479201 RepID=UPI0018E05672|nr:SRPBCC family protein [Roseomonas sp. KE0001]